jgi:hypothetical protein
MVAGGAPGCGSILIAFGDENANVIRDCKIEVDILPHLKEWDSGVIGGNLHRRTYATSSQS